MEKEGDEHTRKKARLCKKSSHKIRNSTLRNIVIEDFPLPLLTDDIIENVWLSKTVSEIAANVDAKFNQDYFIENHPFIDLVTSLTFQQTDQAGQLFVRRRPSDPLPHFVFQNDQYDDFRESTFNPTHSILSYDGTDLRIGHLTFPTELYVRRSYWQLFYLIELLIRIAEKTSYHANFAVIGTSGIGKTYFSLFYMVLAAKREKVFLYQYSQDYITLYGPGFRVTKTCIAMGEWLEITLHRERYIDYYFYDPSSLIGEPDERFICRSRSTIAFTTGNRERFKSFYKHHGAVPLVMKMTTDEEIIEMRDLLSGFQKIRDDDLEDRLSCYGPVPRLVLERCWLGFQDLQDPFNPERLTFLRKVLMGETNIEEGDEDNEGFHHLIHINSSDFSYCERSYTFASMFVVDQVVQRSKRVLSIALLDWITRYRYSFSFAAAVGNVFDAYGHQLFLVGKGFVVNPLPHTDRRYGKDVVQPPFPTLLPFVLRLPEHSQPLSDWNDIQRSIYYIFTNVNMDSADCFFVNGNTLYILQFTVASKHPINGVRVSELITHVQNKFHDVNQCHFIFISPDNIDCIDQIQPLRDNYPSLESIPQNILSSDIHNSQYIIKLDRQVFEEVINVNLPQDD